MPAADELPDSTDWLNTPLSGLAPLESGLRCQVCKDFFTTPMITSCSHTFCSLCIRRYLSQEGRCPACREADQEVKLRRNWTVEELVTYFTRSRDSILSFARVPVQEDDTKSQRPKKRRKFERTVMPPEKRSTRSHSRRLAVSPSQASKEPISTQEEIPGSEDEGSVYEEQSAHESSSLRLNAEPNDGLVACPCCSRRMKENLINAHLDRCIAGLPTSPTPPAQMPPASSTSQPASLAFTQRTKSPVVVAQKDRLPTINYSLLTEAALRKKLKDLGIPAIGNKELMRKRHTEWMNLWNANCDSSRPKTKRELLKELDIWERTLGRQLERGVSSATTGVMVKDFDRDGWAKTQKAEFDDLIKRAREKKKAPVTAGDEVDLSGANHDTQMAEDFLPQIVSEPVNGNSKGEKSKMPNGSLSPSANTTTAMQFPAANDVPTSEQPEALASTNELPHDTTGDSGTRYNNTYEPAIDLTSSPAAGTASPPKESSDGQRSHFFS